MANFTAITLALNVAGKRAVDAFFADRDGHAWEVAWNPFWKLDRKGNVRL